MPQDEINGRVDLRLDEDAARQLDELCAEDVRSRPLELRWLIGQEFERRKAAVTAAA